MLSVFYLRGLKSSKTYTQTHTGNVIACVSTPMSADEPSLECIPSVPVYGGDRSVCVRSSDFGDVVIVGNWSDALNRFTVVVTVNDPDRMGVFD